VPILVLLGFQYESISRQRVAIRALTVANLRLMGERLAEEEEREYLEDAEYTLRDLQLLSTSKAGDPTQERMKAYFQAKNGPPKFGFNDVLLVRADRLVSPPSTSARRETARLLLQNNIQLLGSQQTGKGFPLAFTGSPPTQFFYLETGSGDYIVLSVNLKRAVPVTENARYILGIQNPVRIVPKSGTHAANDVLVPFSIVFPFWELAISPTGPPTQGAPEIAIVAAITSATLILLGFGLLLLTRANWRQWPLNRLRTESVTDVSHDIRAALANISLYSETLASGRCQLDETREFHEIIFRQAQRLSKSVNRVLELSRIQRGKKQFSRSSCELRPTIAKAVQDIESVASPRGFHINLQMPEYFPLLNCDPDAIEQCLANLLENAVKYSGDSRRIEVEATAGGRSTVVAIRDYGIGIPK